jgi:predicted ABC-type ATPase
LQAHIFYSPEMRNANLSHYSKEEMELITEDYKVVKSVCFPQNPKKSRSPKYLGTAGAPGCRKTTILEKFLAKEKEYSNCIYLDPDPRTLRYMVHTYYQQLTPLDICNNSNYEILIKEAYNKWRYASTHIAATLLEEAFTQGYDVAHGTTSTGLQVPKILKSIKTAGYEITLLLCYSNKDFAQKAIRYRNKEIRFYQNSPEDAENKALLFPQRIKTYFTYADKLYFYWSSELFSSEELAATFENGELTIHNEEAWLSFIEKYNNDRLQLMSDGIYIPTWDEQLKSLQKT